MKPTTTFWLRLLSALTLLAGFAAAQAQTRAPWTERTLELFAALPVQEGGRIKPLDTFAQFRLLRFNGKRSFETPAGEKLGPTAFLLDCFFFPELARDYRVFLVRDSALLEAVGVRVAERKKSDRYSYDELAPGRDKLMGEGERVRLIDEKKRSTFDTQLFALATNVHDFEGLAMALEFARAELPTGDSQLLKDVLGSEPATAALVVGRLPELIQRLDALEPAERARAAAAVQSLHQDLQGVARDSSALAVFPPEDPGIEEWRYVDGAIDDAFAGGALPAELLAGWEALEHARTDPAAFETALGKLSARTVAQAERRGEYAKIPLEVRFYQGDYFTRALVFFLLGFLVLCGSWLAPQSRWLVRGVWGASALGTLFVVVGVTLRCIIRARPPVSTLYETILFITAVCAIVLLVIEWIQRQGIALSLVPVLGAAGMFLAMKYELKEATLAGDTMPSLVAVLDTNFWLATHVTTVTMGYAAGLLAAVLGNLWLIGKMVGLKKGDKEFYRTVSRMTYGVVCFGLLLSVVGTILGGIWANYSWGRFWGWDPKENGALLICLAELFILHARMGGYVREHGLAVLAAMNGLAVAFSWWHVNNLGVGLHSYGKTEGVIMALYTYYGIGLLVVVGSLLWRLGAQSKEAPSADVARLRRSEPSA
ncbi:MAG: hypothetical protein EXS08_12490 [Planctomycetes bacterium]|nr:hypothetical protein [Planctomycetota bacterium]